MSMENNIDTGSINGKKLLCHFNTVDETLKKLGVSARNGLSGDDAAKRQQEFGRNELPGKKILSIWSIIFSQFKSPLIYILLAAGAISLIIREFKDAVFIFIVIILNASLGTFQEYRAEKGASSLQDLLKINARVIRDGQKTLIDAEELVPGDIILIGPGSKIPADMRLMEANNLTIDEALLTGESYASEKHTAPVSEDSHVSNCSNTAFAGTEVITGKGMGVVTRTGLQTELGKIARSVYSTASTKTPLVIRMERFSKQIGLIVLGLSLIIGIVMFFMGTPYIEIFLLVTALAVSAIPEGLPVAITVALSISTNRMSKRNVIVRKLASVESLGSCTMIASDKTGTLTMNKQTAKILVSGPGRVFDLENKGFATDDNGMMIGRYGNSKYEEFRRLIYASVIDNDADISRKSESELVFEGNPIDMALLELSQKLGFDPEKARQGINEQGGIPFSSEAKYSMKFYLDGEAAMIAAKGAPEIILSLCGSLMTEGRTEKINKAEIIKETDKLTGQGYRVIAVAEGKFNNKEDLLGNLKKEELPLLTFLGLIAFIDPLRPGVADSIETCKKAGIIVVMITGDHPSTAGTIARQLRIISGKKDIATGEQLEKAGNKTEEEFNDFVNKKKVFARVTPLQKLKIVEAFRNLGHFIAVTGDGVNDAPALKKANIGVAMGSGTDVTKDTASIIITDDSFTSIVAGVEEGRFAYDNIRKVIYLLLATGIAEILLFAITIAFRLPIALLAVQLLWLNLVTNGIQDVALAFEKGEKDALTRPPRKPGEGIFSGLMIQETVLSGVFMGVVAAAVWFFLIRKGWEVDAARNIILMLMVLFENFHAFNCRSEKASVFKVPIKNNYILIGGILAAQGIHLASMYIPFMQRLLGIMPVSLMEWLQLFGIATTIIIVMEVFKVIKKLIDKKSNFSGSELEI
jgi:magnesium-transporting ATPase (P-type)